MYSRNDIPKEFKWSEALADDAAWKSQFIHVGGYENERRDILSAIPSWRSVYPGESNIVFNTKYRISGTPANIQTALLYAGLSKSDIESVLFNAIDKDNYKTTMAQAYKLEENAIKAEPRRVSDQLSAGLFAPMDPQFLFPTAFPIPEKPEFCTVYSRTPKINPVTIQLPHSPSLPTTNLTPIQPSRIIYPPNSNIIQNAHVIQPLNLIQGPRIIQSSNLIQGPRSVPSPRIIQPLNLIQQPRSNPQLISHRKNSPKHHVIQSSSSNPRIIPFSFYDPESVLNPLDTPSQNDYQYLTTTPHIPYMPPKSIDYRTLLPPSVPIAYTIH